MQCNAIQVLTVSCASSTILVHLSGPLLTLSKRKSLSLPNPNSEPENHRAIIKPNWISYALCVVDLGPLEIKWQPENLTKIASSEKAVLSWLNSCMSQPVISLPPYLYVLTNDVWYEHVDISPLLFISRKLILSHGTNYKTGDQLAANEQYLENTAGSSNNNISPLISGQNDCRILMLKQAYH